MEAISKSSLILIVPVIALWVFVVTGAINGMCMCVHCLGLPYSTAHSYLRYFSA